MRGTSCTCDKCISGYMLKCETRTRGCYENYSLNRKCRKTHTNLEDDCYILDSDEDFQYDTSVDNLLTDEVSSDETNFVPSCIEDLSQGNYVLYEWVDNKY